MTKISDSLPLHDRDVVSGCRSEPWRGGLIDAATQLHEVARLQSTEHLRVGNRERTTKWVSRRLAGSVPQRPQTGLRSVVELATQPLQLRIEAKTIGSRLRWFDPPRSKSTDERRLTDLAGALRSETVACPARSVSRQVVGRDCTNKNVTRIRHGCRLGDVQQLIRWLSNGLLKALLLEACRWNSELRCRQNRRIGRKVLLVVDCWHLRLSRRTAESQVLIVWLNTNCRWARDRQARTRLLNVARCKVPRGGTWWNRLRRVVPTAGWNGTGRLWCEGWRSRWRQGGAGGKTARRGTDDRRVWCGTARVVRLSGAGQQRARRRRWHAVGCQKGVSHRRRLAATTYEVRHRKKDCQCA